MMPELLELGGRGLLLGLAFLLTAGMLRAGDGPLETATDAADILLRFVLAGLAWNAWIAGL